ncbi:MULTISPECIES: dihydrolipoyllysine-residue acetyltransferase [Marinobacter]|jgi:pyruvate dehydrogenase E2 component (dihydrolipoamide acetyltransferase)|uniref:Acetyltransferase component of pyruvate dehydrogenase complex n=1 Tax=Marinobacter nauticus TaxID=2743 RepID=A0A833JQZ1_MARNT|nr:MULTISPECIES: dihydrolipoyllysine-residue acetyltransferase [Marinobacter]MAH31339.1 dihydrolipoyllysine-residue acetyltransferase [Marinobacter sp.]MEC8824115.1 dihydrolipoyllysine-residue acetyltransferase [Pseudomonadota bacterium]KAE8545986.1 Dihydrolipoamide acetyltransferase component of pyruvate dehydrogenase complex [Marinobacter nauticus]MCS5561208.1 dihydrolipoyllysine-residue acetyltransferase [Marinobacter nauticus]MEC9384903.1 dihydrolipoyllysine-residue acetyltransferase [Pseu|tara:strand:+ start:7983 stop:9641 length:1659 start_codon:yes stop_codon:yes gene_type:complete
MSEQEIKVPDLGGADEVEIIEIIVSEGDSVEEEDPILTVESDKASVELPAPVAGKISKITVKVGDKVKEGDVIGMLAASGDAGGSDDAADDKSEQTEEKSEAPSEARSEDAKPAPKKKKSGGSRTEVVKVPSLDGFEDVPVIEINVAEGDTVGEEDPLVTVESDKATMEIPSPYAGKIGKILVKEGDKLSEGSDLLEMTIEDDGDDEGESEDSGDSARADSQESKPEKSQGKQESEPQPQGSTYEPPSPGTKVHAGPAVRKLARELGADLTRVKGSGPKGRIVKDDVHAYVKSQLQQAQQGSGVATGSGIPGVKLPDFSQFGEIEREGMSRMMAATATNMQRSWLNVPHVTQFDDADITEMEAFRKGQKAAGEKRGVKMTPLPFLLKACAAALAELPQFNVSLDMERKEVVRKKYIHIGIAVDTPHGLMVPVIRNVDQKGLWELAAESAELAQKARDKQLKPAEMQGACFTITSLGGIGGTAFTPIVNTPEVAILGVSKASMKPVWDGKEFQPRLMLPLSLSYDHRAVNGADAARFTNLLTQLLGDIRTLLL